MNQNIYLKKKLASNWFILLQEIICYEFEKIEEEFGKKNRLKPKFFNRIKWKKSNTKNEGGGISATIKNGLVFDKVGVNFSEVYGNFNKNLRLKIPGAKKKANYWASGISIVAHMKNPKIPAMHLNTRFIVTQKNWFGGGIDSTPCIIDLRERKMFHKKLQNMCNRHNKNYYKKYKKWCDNYFYLPHRKEMRGIGGIFFDYKQDNWKNNFNFTKDVGLCFLDYSKNIIKNRMLTKWTKKEKKRQLIKRGRYIEFNLLYDRGTKFGLNTGGNIEAILMSLPPEAKWE